MNSAKLTRTVEFGLTLLENFLGFGIGCFVDWFEKKLILQLSLGSLGVTLFGLFFFFQNMGKGVTGKLVLILVYVVLYPPTLGLIPWVMTPKLFPLQIRSFGCAIGSFANYTSNLFVTLTLPGIKKLEPKTPFLAYGCLSIIGLLAVSIFITRKIATSNALVVHPDRTN